LYDGRGLTITSNITKHKFRHNIIGAYAKELSVKEVVDITSNVLLVCIINGFTTL